MFKHFNQLCDCWSCLTGDNLARKSPYCLTWAQLHGYTSQQQDLDHDYNAKVHCKTHTMQLLHWTQSLRFDKLHLLDECCVLTKSQQKVVLLPLFWLKHYDCRTTFQVLPICSIGNVAKEKNDLSCATILQTWIHKNMAWALYVYICEHCFHVNNIAFMFTCFNLF